MVCYVLKGTGFTCLLELPEDEVEVRFQVGRVHLDAIYTTGKVP